MPYIVVENMAAGVDRRRPIYASKQGSLWEGINGHLTRGGDFEKAKAFVSTYNLASLSTFGLQTVSTNVYVFGSVATPGGLPSGVNYQRLQHPDGLAMASMVFSTLYEGKIYAIAKYSDDSLIHFYDGVLVTDWHSGRVTSSMTDVDGIAEHMKDLIAADTTYTATRATDTITITAAAAGTPFTITKATEDEGGTDDQDITLTETVANISGGTEVVATGSIKVTGGTSNPGTNKITSVTVDGIEILSTAVDWTTSNSNTASLIATQINSYSSSPEYTANASAGVVTISAAAATGIGPNGFLIGTTVAGDITIGSIVDMNGGVAGTSNVAQKYTAEIIGTFEVGDLFTIILDEKVFGHQGNPDTVAQFVLTHDTKIYGTADSIMNFSAVNSPTKWNTDTDIGAGAINMSNQDEGSSTLYGLAAYQGNMAVFSNKTIQIWYVEADDDNNVRLQTLRRTGTRSGKSIQSFGDTDVFYLDSTGVRSLRARDSSNNASVNDVGTLVDTLVQGWMSALTSAQIQAIPSIIEPEDSRYWLAIGSRILVFSYFPGSKISGWTWYEPGFSAEWLSDSGDNTGPYVRSGDLIYKYGGSDNATYDSSTVTCWLPFLDAGKPGHNKAWHSVDLMSLNTWAMTLLVDPEALAKDIQIGDINGFSLLEDNTDMIGDAPMVSPKLICTAAGAASISSLILHYNLLDSETDGG